MIIIWDTRTGDCNNVSLNFIALSHSVYYVYYNINILWSLIFVVFPIETDFHLGITIYYDFTGGDGIEQRYFEIFTKRISVNISSEYKQY